MNTRTLLKITCLLMFAISNYSFSQKATSEITATFNSISNFIEQKEFEKAQKKIEELAELSPENLELHHIKLELAQANIHIAQQDDESALSILLDDFDRLSKYSNTQTYLEYAETIGRIFGRAKNYKEASNYFRLGLNESKQRNDSLAIASSNLNLGSLFQMQQQIDSAAYYYDKVLQYYPEITEDKGTLATAYSNLIGVSLMRGNFDLAEDYGIKSLEIHTELKDTLKMAGVLSNLGSIKMYTKELEKSNEYYFKALDLLENPTNLKGKEIKVITLDNISQVYYMQGDYKTGYDYLFEGLGLDKELVKELNENKITEIQAKYNVAKREKDTAIEKGKRVHAEFMTYLLGSIIFALLVFLIQFNSRNKLKAQKQALEFEKEKMLQIREIENVQNDSQIKILNATLDGKEAERRHIAEILHDNVSTLLSSANMHLYAVRMELKENAPEEVAKIEMIINEASDKIRDLSHKLISSVLLKFGLATSTEDLCEKYSNSQLVFNSDSKNIKRYDESFEIKIHNIIEELVNNILKHSDANMASIKLKEEDNTLFIEIIDNGDGFSLREVATKDGLGLSQVRARIKVMEGSFKVKTADKEGTHIKMVIPIPE